MVNSYNAVVNSFYLAYYGRPADPAGLAFWSMQLERAGGDFGVLVEAFATSEEATARFGGDTASERIATIYQQVFDRAPDADGLAFWVAAVENGATTLAAVAMDMLHGAQGSDIAISMLRQQAAADFTGLVSSAGIAFDGYAAIEASRALVAAVRADTSAADVAAMVKAAGSLVQTIHDTPAVLAALGTDGQLASLFSTARGQAEGADLLQALADVAKAAAGNPDTLDSLLRGGGMAKVLQVMPANATLHDVVDALAAGGLPAAVEVVYPTDPAPAPAPAPTLDIKFDAGTLTLAGDARFGATVDLDAHTVGYDGKLVAVGDGADIAKVAAAAYPGQVTLSGKVATLEAVLAQSTGVDAYRIVDGKDALFTGPAQARTLVPAAIELLKGAGTVMLADALSAAEAALLRNLDGFDTSKLVATVDETAPAAGTLHFVVGEETLGAPLTNHDSFILKVDGFEAGAQVRYQVADGQGGWTDLETSAQTGVLEGSHSYRAVVVDAAGNVSYTEAAAIVVDQTVPSVASMDFAVNDGKLALGEPVELTVSFSKAVQVDGAAALAFSNGGSAVYVSGSGSDKLVFKYTPAAGQSTGILKLAELDPFGGTITDKAGNALPANAFDDIGIGNTPAVDAQVPAQTLMFTTIAQLRGDSESVAGTEDPLSTNIGQADVHATLSAQLAAGERVEASFDGGLTWSSQGVTTAGTAVTVAGVATVANPTVSLRVVDEAGNAGTVASRAIAYDATPPAHGTLGFAGLELSSHAGPLDMLGSDGDFSLQLQGMEAGARIVYEMRPGQGEWQVMDAPTVTDLPEGRYNFHAIVTDAAGNSSTTDAIALDLDRTGPAVVSAAFAANDGKLALGESVELAVTFGEVVYTDGSATIALDNGGSATYIRGSGTEQLVFKYTPAAGQGSDGVDVSSSAPVGGVLTDRAGNQPADDAFEGIGIGNAPLVDVVAPMQTVTSTSITRQAGEGPGVTGTSNTLATNQAIADVHATLSAALGTDEHVEVSWDEGHTWSSENVSTNGTTVTIERLMTTFGPTLTLRVVDAAGNAGAQVSRTIVLDNTAPEGGSLTFVSVGQSDLDQYGNDNVTNIAVPTFTFQHDGPWLGNGEYYEYSVDGTHWIREISYDPGTGLVTFYPDISQGTPDSNGRLASTVSVRAIDDAGNVQALASKAVVYDGSAAAPTVTLDEDSTGKYGSDDDFVTSKGDYSVSGLEGDAYVEYSLTGEGGWTADKPAAVEGPNKIWVHQVDVAGNTSRSTLLEFTLDTVDPSAPTATLAWDGGANDADRITNSGTVNVSGLETAAGTAWEYQVDGGDWTRGGVIDAQGKSSLAVTVDGEHTVLVRQYDAAGNLSGNGTLGFTLDATAATLSFDHVEGWTGTARNATLLDQADVVFGYTGDVTPGDKIEYRFGTGNWLTSDQFVLDTVNHTITLPDFDLSGADGQFVMRVTDALGNASNEASTTIDGPYGNPVITMSFSEEGLTLTSSGDGTLYTRSAAGGTLTRPVLSNGEPVQVSAGVPILLGAQSTALAGVIFGIKTDSGTVYLDQGTNSYWLGTNSMESTSLPNGQTYVIWGFGGNDTFLAHSGNDILYGGDGDDKLYGMAGDDYLNGGTGTNILTGGAGVDRIDIMLGQNTLNYVATDSTVGGFDVVTFDSVDYPMNTAPQTFHFENMVSGVSRIDGVLPPAGSSSAELLATLESVFQQVEGAGGIANRALIVDFEGGDRYLVKDNGDGHVTDTDYVIKLVGSQSLSIISSGNDVIFGGGVA